mmetsp:Transcript_22755/g.74084  ORF Transcript_22755/g.74084 Transcript_22755/m.74084 type:complete len:107 (+) Transcript_22755:90-410(+)
MPGATTHAARIWKEQTDKEERISKRAQNWYFDRDHATWVERPEPLLSGPEKLMLKAKEQGLDIDPFATKQKAKKAAEAEEASSPKAKYEDRVKALGSLQRLQLGMG